MHRSAAIRGMQWQLAISMKSRSGIDRKSRQQKVESLRAILS
jgi:hypothetical protein